MFGNIGSKERLDFNGHLFVGERDVPPRVAVQGAEDAARIERDLRECSAGGRRRRSRRAPAERRERQGSRVHDRKARPDFLAPTGSVLAGADFVRVSARWAGGASRSSIVTASTISFDRSVLGYQDARRFALSYEGMRVAMIMSNRTSVRRFVDSTSSRFSSRWPPRPSDARVIRTRLSS